MQSVWRTGSKLDLDYITVSQANRGTATGWPVGAGTHLVVIYGEDLAGGQHAAPDVEHIRGRHQNEAILATAVRVGEELHIGRTYIIMIPSQMEPSFTLCGLAKYAFVAELLLITHVHVAEAGPAATNLCNVEARVGTRLKICAGQDITVVGCAVAPQHGL